LVKKNKDFPVLRIDPIDKLSLRFGNASSEPSFANRLTAAFCPGDLGMTHFVILTFLFLAYAFCELSEGADFEPRGTR